MINYEEIRYMGIYSLINIVSFYTVVCYFSSKLNVKGRNYRITNFFIFISYLLINSATLLCVKNPGINLIIQVGLLFLITTMYSGSLPKKLNLIFNFIGFMVLIELGVGYGYSLFIDNQESFKVEMSVYNLVGAAISRIIALAFVKLIQARNRNIDKAESLNYVELLKIIIIPIGSIFILHTLHILVMREQKFSYELAICSILILAGINVYFNVLFDRVKASEKEKYKNELLKSNMQYYMEKQKVLEARYQDIRIIKHDLKHQLLHIKSKLCDPTEENLQELVEGINDILGDIRPEHIGEYSENAVINAILNYKLAVFQSRRIPIKMNVSVGRDSILKEKLLYILLGNIFDNAAENFDNTAAEQKELVIRITEETDNLYIGVFNPYHGKITMKNNSPVTQKKDQLSHGIGLKSIKQLVKDHNGTMRFSTMDHIFSIEIILFDGVVKHGD